MIHVGIPRIQQKMCRNDPCRHTKNTTTKCAEMIHVGIPRIQQQNVQKLSMYSIIAVVLKPRHFIAQFTSSSKASSVRGSRLKQATRNGNKSKVFRVKKITLCYKVIGNFY